MADRKEMFFPKSGVPRGNHVFANVITMDPGLEGTGWAIFAGLRADGKPKSRPISSGVIRPKKIGSWQQKANDVCCTFVGIVAACENPVIIMEFPELWATGKSFASASGAQGDLFKLAYLVGGLARTGHELAIFQPVLVSPRDWKGQLPKDVVMSRIRKVLGDIRLRDHEADAIGIGLAAQGLL